MSTLFLNCFILGNALEILSAHILIASIPEQASVTSLRSLLAGVVELALGFPVEPCVISIALVMEGGSGFAYVSNFRRLSSDQA